MTSSLKLHHCDDSAVLVTLYKIRDVEAQQLLTVSQRNDYFNSHWRHWFGSKHRACGAVFSVFLFAHSRVCLKASLHSQIQQNTILLPLTLRIGTIYFLCRLLTLR